jgi:hypothetical protein
VVDQLNWRERLRRDPHISVPIVVLQTFSCPAFCSAESWQTPAHGSDALAPFRPYHEVSRLPWGCSKPSSADLGSWGNASHWQSRKVDILRYFLHRAFTVAWGIRLQTCLATFCAGQRCRAKRPISSCRRLDLAAFGHPDTWTPGCLNTHFG